MIDISGILDGLASHAQRLGYFENVLLHEPKSAPQNGMTCAFMFERLRAFPAGSGQTAGTGLLVCVCRVYINMLQEPQDDIDKNAVEAVDALFAAYAGDFELGGKVREIDIMGTAGFPLSAQAGYVTVDNKIFRFIDVTIPLIINDLWSLSP